MALRLQMAFAGESAGMKAKISKRAGARLEKQRERQQRLREEAKAARRPSRDDVARALLHIAITLNLSTIRKTNCFLDRPCG
jgi:hypothetical protein